MSKKKPIKPKTNAQLRAEIANLKALLKKKTHEKKKSATKTSTRSYVVPKKTSKRSSNNTPKTKGSRKKKHQLKPKARRSTTRLKETRQGDAFTRRGYQFIFRRSRRLTEASLNELASQSYKIWTKLKDSSDGRYKFKIHFSFLNDHARNFQRYGLKLQYIETQHRWNEYVNKTINSFIKNSESYIAKSSSGKILLVGSSGYSYELLK